MDNRMYIFIFLGTLLTMFGMDCQAMKVAADTIRRTAIGTEKRDWMLLRERIVADSQMPDREDVLMLIDYHRDNFVRCENLLRQLNGGKAYRYITTFILPVLDIPLKEPLPALTVDEAAPVYTEVKCEYPERIDAVARIEKKENQPVIDRRVVLALKNNLLYDLALAPNIEVEVSVGKRWSVNAEYKCPWWLNSSKKFCYQLLSGGVEGRCWLGNRRLRNSLAGHFMGVYAEGGVYDFQYHNDGYQGDYYVASGVSYGYAKQLARHFSLEFSLGVGYLTTKYRKYASWQENLVRTDSGKSHWVGPTKLKVSLVWLLTAKR